MYKENQLTLDQTILLGQYLALELVKVEEHFVKSSEEFYKVYKHKPIEKVNNVDIKKEAEQTLLKKTCKQLYNALAKKAHPDISNLDDLFVDVDVAYKKLDIITLYSYVKTLNIKISKATTQAAPELISKQIEAIKARTQALKTTLGWRWYNSAHQEREIIERFIEKTFKLEKH